MSLEGYDFSRGEATREQMRTAAVEGAPADIAAALREPGVPDDLLVHRPEVVSSLDSLDGPALGPIQVPQAFTSTPLADVVMVDDPRHCALLYQRVLLRGNSTMQRQVLNRERLIELWPYLAKDLPSALARVWQERFPDLKNRQAPWSPRML
ncbi:hypothetical protein ACH4VR_29165 [Streptomyces sp. NPDC020883]|uniref:hypothetical protein n=1 Tax=Streptomyces sp. NPDC020883 TaxID=3365099 RepID=UPI0037AF6159